MNKKIIIGICLSIIILSMSLNPIAATDSSDWKEINISGVNFKIPPKYADGKLVGNTYMLETVFDFSIASLNDNSSLKEIYGYESTIEELNDLKLKEVGGHDTVILHSYRSVCEHNVSYVFFAVGKNIFAISFNGDKITPEIEEIIKNTPKSKISKEILYKKLDKAQEDYVQEQMDYDEAYEYSESYREGYYDGAKDMKSHSPSFVDYYCAYRITNYLMK
ncbi:MAG: hypothetical protein MJ203_02980 [archaeon]|nr:hypothetical protein [archaeon]